jgi:hypothetical protein
MKANKIPVTYVVFPDEGHGFATPKNNMAFCALVELFLSTHLGGTVQALGTDLSESSAEVKERGGLII